MPKSSYLSSLGVLPTWKLSDDDLQSVPYRCRRMRGLINVYYWALTWTLHREDDWTLGEEPYPFLLDQKLLWILGIETIRDLAHAGWENTTERITVKEREDPEEGASGPFGEISLSDVEWAAEPWQEVGERLSVRAVSATSGRDEVVFEGDDVVVSVCFQDHYQYIPWLTICSALDRAYKPVEQYLVAAHIRWNGSPVFRHHRSGWRLLEDISARRLDNAVVLQDLEHRRLELVAEVETVLRAQLQSAEVPPNPAGQSSIERKTDGMGLLLAEEADDGGPWLFMEDGDGYRISGFGESGHMSKKKGFEYIHRLVQTPNTGVPMMTLNGADEDRRIVADHRSCQPMIENEELAKLKCRLQDSRADRERAIKGNNTVEIGHCDDDIAKVSDLLKSLTGIGGRARDLNNPMDKLRSSIHAALQRAYEQLRNATPPMKKLADHLDTSISTESGEFIYRPTSCNPSWTTKSPGKL
jgi:hypothetical protein